MDKVLRILNIEDSESDAALLRRHLTLAGYQVLFDRVDTAEGMKAALERQEWDVILCDYAMPTFNAPAALAMLKKTELDIPFIVISGTIGEEVAVSTMVAGAHDYLMKSNLPRLKPAIERELAEVKVHKARKEAEEALRNSEAELRALFAAMVDVIIVFNRQGLCLKIAPTDPTYLYKPSDDLIGKTVFQVYPKEEANLFLEHIQQALNEGRMHRVEYSRRIRENQVWFEGTLSPMSKDRVLWVAHDITERRNLEEQFRQSQKMEAVGNLAGGIAHDFNNLLTGIIGYSDLSLMRLAPQDPGRAAIEEIRKAGERAGSLARQLLAFSRKQMLQPKVFDMNHTVSEMHKMLQRVIGEHIELETLLDPLLGRVKADPGQFGQVLMNLAVNARDAMPRGGRLTIGTANVDLAEGYDSMLATVGPRPYMVLTVSDTGCGMNKQTQDRIFEPFFTTKGVGKGTGLGLSMVYGIVKQSGGSICVHSEVGKGTLFEIYLPRVEMELQEIRQNEDPDELARGTETILLTEDDAVVRQLTSMVLTMQGYQVLEAANGSDALSICQSFEGTIHLLLTDLVMPEMNGRELALRLAAARPEMQVLYMSGYAADVLDPHKVSNEQLNFIQKPFTPAALSQKVREVLDSAILLHRVAAGHSEQ